MNLTMTQPSGVSLLAATHRMRRGALELFGSVQLMQRIHTHAHAPELQQPSAVHYSTAGHHGA